MVSKPIRATLLIGTVLAVGAFAFLRFHMSGIKVRVEPLLGDVGVPQMLFSVPRKAWSDSLVEPCRRARMSKNYLDDALARREAGLKLAFPAVLRRSNDRYFDQWSDSFRLADSALHSRALSVARSIATDSAALSASGYAGRGLAVREEDVLVLIVTDTSYLGGRSVREVPVNQSRGMHSVPSDSLKQTCKSILPE